MNITIEDYLKVLYPNPDILDDKEKKQYLKDKKFLDEHLDDTNRFYSRFLKSKEDLGVSELEYTQEIMDMAKKKFDKETIIVEYVDYMLSVLDKNSFIQNDFETFINLLYIDQSYQEEYKNESIDTTPIKLEEVFKFTEEFLSEIDDSKEMVTEFKNLRDSEKIIIVSSDEKIGSKYKDGKIIYEFDGTIDSANTLVHEFMHHWMDFKGNPTLNRELYTMFNEFLPIYYENAFIKYLDDKGVLENGERPLIASRLKFEKEKDPNNVLIKLLELSKSLKEKGKIEKEDIIEVLEKYAPENATKQELWNNEADKMKEFCEEHFLGSETISGPVMYRLNNGLALDTNYNIETVKKIYKLAEFVRDREQDAFFIEEYNRITQSKDFGKSISSEINSIDDNSKSVKIKPKEIVELDKSLQLDSQEMNQAKSVLKQGERSLDN